MKIHKTILGLLFMLVVTPSQSAILESCSWDNPGANPYTNTVPVALAHYMDVAPATKAKLERRMLARQYDDLVTITRDQITGTHSYQPQITDMHFGGKTTKPQICLTTPRDKWAIKRKEIGLVYCEDRTCIMVPTICNNVSRIQRIPESGITTGSRGSNSDASTQSAPPTAEGQPSGGGGGGPVLDTPVRPLVVEGNSSVSTVGFTPIPAWAGSFGGGGCCFTGPVKPSEPIIPIVTPILPPIIITPPEVPAVPEPSTILMLLLGLGAMLLFLQRRKRGNSGNK